MTPEHNPFSDYHRARWQAGFVRIAAVAVSIVVSMGLVSLVEPASPPEPRAAAASSASEFSAAAGSSAPGEFVPDAEPVEGVDLPTPPAVAPASPAPPAPTTAATLPSTGPASWSIAVDTRGHQNEIDQCLWVRMDLGGHAPIVGAHNYCGGGVVLDMALGDVVTMTGTDLDGAYVVSDARDARVGDPAAVAIADVVADVVVQTCYWGGNGRVRLVGLTLVAPSSP